MEKLHIITPVKDSLETLKLTIASIKGSEIGEPYTYTIYNDFSSEPTGRYLEENQQELGYRLVNLSDFTDHPSPNYRLTLAMAQRQALAAEADLLIIESDVQVRPDTIRRLLQAARRLEKCGMAAALTVDKEGNINFPYNRKYILLHREEVLPTRKNLSFCCTLLTRDFLKTTDFGELSCKKNWFDVKISHDSIKNGFNNYILTSLKVLHTPHGSRPWKLLKYSHPFKYYWQKYTRGRDKI